jgi:hypothetical protein
LYLYSKLYGVTPQGTVTFLPWDFSTKTRYWYPTYFLLCERDRKLQIELWMERKLLNYMTPSLYFSHFSATCSVVGPSVRVGMLGAASCGLLVVAQLFLLLLTVTVELIPSLPVTPVASSSVRPLRPATGQDAVCKTKHNAVTERHPTLVSEILMR